MRTTGVVRRIDELGRIVIPKEIRRTLRIKDGESLEIFVENEMIALKKFSSINDLRDICNDLVNTINQVLSKNILITDRDSVISFSGVNKSKYIDKKISKYLDEKIKNREYVMESTKHQIEFVEGLNNLCSYVISPIIANGDVIGVVVVFSEKEDIIDLDAKLTSIAANFLGRHIEE